jgi:hypothetical protein
MKKSILLYFFLAAFTLFSSPLISQDWVSMMQDPNVNFHETQKAFYKYEQEYRTLYKKERGVEPEKVPGYKIFKRWEWFMAPRVSSNGERFSPDAAWKAIEQYKKESSLLNAGNWTSMGPTICTEQAA